MEKKHETCRLHVSERLLSRIAAFLYGACVMSALFEFAKKIRTVIFYNKKLKQPLCISEINT